jgi:hypothetical protein
MISLFYKQINIYLTDRFDFVFFVHTPRLKL